MTHCTQFITFFIISVIQLVGGSAGTEQTDERENAPEGEATVAKSADGYTEGIPGPVTRLFVLANRGLANLIQDLILVSVTFLELSGTVRNNFKKSFNIFKFKWCKI